MLKHYAPKTPLKLNIDKPNSDDAFLDFGNKKVILCERGVSVPHTHRSTSRFLLDLQVIPAARDFTHIPIISCL
mgnify:CR=1 FL=1